jgi:hypothetical protein
MTHPAVCTTCGFADEYKLVGRQRLIERACAKCGAEKTLVGFVSRHARKALESLRPKCQTPGCSNDASVQWFPMGGPQLCDACIFPDGVPSDEELFDNNDPLSEAEPVFVYLLTLRRSKQIEAMHGVFGHLETAQDRAKELRDEMGGTWSKRSNRSWAQKGSDLHFEIAVCPLLP